jgi:phage terminase large subunit
LQLLTLIAQSRKLTIDIAGESLPHLKRGVLRDFPTIFEQFGLNFELMFNRSDSFLKFSNGTKINFIALDNPGKARGSRRDILFINEANLIPYETAQQLFIRTHETIFIDYNPTNTFWVHNQIIPQNPDRYKLIKSNYKDNQCLSQAEIDELESRRGDGNNNFWRVYGLGELGIAEGLIFENIEAITLSDDEVRRFDRIREGIDWGFAIDPFVFIKGHYDRKHHDLYLFDEIYKVGLSNEAAMPLVWEKHTRSTEIVADSEEPKSIYDFQNSGLPVVKARKGAGSVSYGIKKLQGLRHIFIDPARCPNAYREYTSYAYEEDRNGDLKSLYPDKNNHTIDATRYMLQDDFEY